MNEALNLNDGYPINILGRTEYISPYLTQKATNEKPTNPTEQSKTNSFMSGLSSMFGFGNSAPLDISPSSEAVGGTASSGISGATSTGGDLIMGSKFDSSNMLLIGAGIVLGFVTLKWLLK
jgi:hypothetical protein